ncbi:hypothetical protein TrRE_jg7848 [Triparma retinervis]|uniref:Uncharacterized protein n=1 Tax=Triparma retinervis TaxID=2557542 RepID=A0A9W7AVH6_9STRA|nr:hypothetical protein TrRE_jg7848 [Triparma retinervis]
MNTTPTPLPSTPPLTPADTTTEENSAIAAAATRGSARALLQRTALQTRSAAAKTASNTASRVGVGRIPVKQLAKVADKTATGLDLQESMDVGSIKRARGFRARLSGVSAGVKEFARVGILGVVAWEGYDGLMEYGRGRLYKGKGGDDPTVKLACASGFAAGSAHAFASLGFDLVRSATPKFPAYRVFSHGASHMVLFGAYEFGAGAGLSEPGGGGDVEAGHALKVGMIGGTAGVASQVVSTITENMENVGRIKETPKIPGFRTMLTSAFLPSALAFMAFEYGKEVYGEEG